MQIKKTVFFVTKGWFCYGQGESIVWCFADAMDNTDNLSKDYPKAFYLEHAIMTNQIVDTEKYCVCYDDSDDYGQKAFFDTGLKVKEKLLSLYHKGKISYAWIFPMSKVIKTSKLEKAIRNNADDYNKVAEWLDVPSW